MKYLYIASDIFIPTLITFGPISMAMQAYDSSAVKSYSGAFMVITGLVLLFIKSTRQDSRIKKLEEVIEALNSDVANQSLKGRM
jgi:hypothetical protein